MYCKIDKIKIFQIADIIDLSFIMHMTECLSIKVKIMR